jgi:hypothetical protein
VNSTIYGPDGTPLKRSDFKKADPPNLGEAFGGNWGGRDLQYLNLPGGGIIQFDLSKLRLSDYRQMRDHYQVNASLTVLTFMMHQLDWRIECDDKRIADHCTENMENIWTRLVRALSQSFWAGYSPCVLQWENDVQSKTIQLTKIKDLVPEESHVNFKRVQGWAPPNHVAPWVPVYDGIKVMNQSWPIPVQNTLWYPLLMENGDMYGKKLLRSAFPSWFFSILIHLFSNRYYERYGEPVPIGRAPYEEKMNVNGVEKSGIEVMSDMLTSLRNRSVVVLPSDKTLYGSHSADFDYSIEYLESQMRGADFERYMTRLDEEISLAMFTPILLLRTADVGSYSLGEGHMQIWLWMLNALAGDWKEYIDKYILNSMKNFNFGPNAPQAKIVFRKMGKADSETIRAMIQSLFQQGAATVDFEQLSSIAGLTIEQSEQVTAPEETGGAGDGGSGNEDVGVQSKSGTSSSSSRVSNNGKSIQLGQVRAASQEIENRLRPQVARAFRDDKFGKGFAPSFGFQRRFETALEADGFSDCGQLTQKFFTKMNNWFTDVSALGTDEFSTPDQFMSLFSKVIRSEVENLAVQD